MKKNFFFLISILIISNVYSQNISLDNTFANNGILQIPSTVTSEINDIDIDTNGNVYSASTTSQGSGTGVYKLTVSKSNSIGVLDNQFGNNGISLISFEHSEYPLAIKVLSNSKILVCGSAYTGHTPNGPGLHIGFLVRLNSDGSIDSSFANNGILKLDNIESHFTSIITLNNNMIILAGNINNQAALLKITENGVIDIQFGINGILYLSTQNFNFILWKSVLDNNEILSVGYDFTIPTNPRIAYCKIDLNGNFVSSFGSNGKVVLDLYNSIPNTWETLTSIRKYVNHYYLAGNHASNFIIRINENGDIDNNFGVSGILNHSNPFKDFDIQSNGKILVCGSKLISDYNYGYSLVRYNNDGTFDSTLNNGNSFDIDISNNNDYMQTVRYFSNKLYIGGSSFYNVHSKSTVVRLNLEQELSIGDNPKSDFFNIYPNPFSDYLFIDCKTELIDINLFDVAGRKILTEINDNKIEIKENVASGIYFIRLIDNFNNQITKKIIKQ
jgi:uncharacterized delta-60 repeat protein